MRGCGGWWDVLSKLDPGQRELWHQRWPLPLRSPGRWRRLITGQREGGMKGQAARPRGLLHRAGARVTLDWGNWSRQGCVSWLLGSHDVCFRSSLPNRVLVNWCALEWTGMQSFPTEPIQGESLLPRPLFATSLLTASPQPGQWDWLCWSSHLLGHFSRRQLCQEIAPRADFFSSSAALDKILRCQEFTEKDIGALPV